MAKGRELRIGLVLYGGVSLAIYIYGVVVEIQRLLEAADAGEPQASDEADDSKSAAYREALELANFSKVTVDVLSGTSAGGINAILLAKALAQGGDVREVRDLWIKDGGIEDLLHPASAKDPHSLFQSKYLERKLEAGLKQLDGGRQRNASDPAEVLDLFVSATHLRGGPRRFNDSLDGEIHTRQHHCVFHLELRRKLPFGESRYGEEPPTLGHDADDFKDNSRLVKLARATSAFPVAFEPVRIEQGDDFHSRRGAPLPAGWYADGGILNNKPFTEALDTTFSRRADRPVRRWLFSVDPSPATLEDEQVADAPPPFDEIAINSVASIPRYQSIARDLAALEEHNERVGATEQVVLDLEARLQPPPEHADRLGESRAVEWVSEPLGPGPDEAYLTLRRQAWEVTVASRLLRAPRPGPELDRAALHSTFRRVAAEVWEERGATGAEEWNPETAAWESRPWDLVFERRRVYYLIKLIGLARSAGPDTPDHRLDATREVLWVQFEAIQYALWSGIASETLAIREGEDAASAAKARMEEAVDSAADVARSVRASLQPVLDDLVLTFRNPRSDRGDDFSADLGHVFREFNHRDPALLSAEVLGGMWRRDRAKHAQISPASARSITDRPEQKLAGTALANFGGLLNTEWRENDLMWGRLDGAEIAMRAILAEASDEERVKHEARLVEEAQEEILRDEQPGALEADGGWKNYLVNRARPVDGVAAKKMVGAALRAIMVFRAMLLTAKEEVRPGPIGRLRGIGFGVAARVLGAVVALVYLPIRAATGDLRLTFGLISLVLFLPFLWGLSTLILGLFGIVPLSEVAKPAAIGIAIYLVFLLGYAAISRLVAKIQRA